MCAMIFYIITDYWYTNTKHRFRFGEYTSKNIILCTLKYLYSYLCLFVHIYFCLQQFEGKILIVIRWLYSFHCKCGLTLFIIILDIHRTFTYIGIYLFCSRLKKSFYLTFFGNKYKAKERKKLFFPGSIIEYLL